jgi:predicted nucleic acid-binding protein
MAAIGPETRRRLRASRQRVNALIDALSHVLVSVDYTNAPIHDLAWLHDRDDWPVMQTALAAKADTLVTDNATDFPLDDVRNGIRIVGSSTFLAALYHRFPDAEATIREFLQEPDDDPILG